MLRLRPFWPRSMALPWGGLALSSIGDQAYAVAGPMQDIPIAALLQTERPRADIGAATRAYTAADQIGLPEHCPLNRRRLMGKDAR